MNITASDKITIQSMTTVYTADVDGTAAQIGRLEALGCDIVRVAVPDMDCADAVAQIKKRILIPLVADIHFDYKLALRAVECGADKIRINPGNIGSFDKVKAVADACRERGIPIRVGVNSGSLEKPLLDKYGGVTAAALAESALGHVGLLERCGFGDIWISAKTPHVPLMAETYRILHEKTDYPLHIGVTEAGTEYSGIIKNAIGIGALLLSGIGNTIRVSLTAEPEREVIAAKAILKALGLRGGIDVIACPACGRCRIDVRGITEQVENALEESSAALAPENAKARLRDLKHSTAGPQSGIITIAIMGCAVNGPGEASQADYGIAGGDGEGVIFAKGKIIRKVPMSNLTDELLRVVYDKS